MGCGVLKSGRVQASYTDQQEIAKTTDDEEPPKTEETRSTKAAKVPQEGVNNNNTAIIAGPRDATCHICGRNYTIHSIHIHVPQCEKLWAQRQEKLPRYERKPKLLCTSNADKKMTLQERNELAIRTYNNDALEPCQYCSRTFLPDRLVVHLRSCAKNHGKTTKSLSNNSSLKQQQHQQQQETAKKTPPPPRKPRDVICHVCGRKYTVHSIDIHLPQCEKLFLQRQRNLRKENRKPLPKLQGNVGNMSLKERNELASSVAFEPCEHCGRTFFPDRLQVHLRSCSRQNKCGAMSTKQR